MLRDWWTKEDAARFDVRAGLLADQYSECEPLTDAHINGRLTLGGFRVAGDGELSFSLWGKNLTNTEWQIFQFNVVGTGLAGVTQYFWNEPRTYGLEARLKF